MNLARLVYSVIEACVLYALCHVLIQMLLNEETIITGSKCKLVPYTRDLVEQYHSWFLSYPELLETTGSDLLTLDEEYINQESWRTDESKLTFLIRDMTVESLPLCGDINCFFSEYYKQDFEDTTGSDDDEYAQEGLVGEINVMVAEPGSRRKGIAEEAMGLFIEYMKTHITGLRVLIAKIQMTNTPSIRMFEKLGFKEWKRVECFGEIHFISSNF